MSMTSPSTSISRVRTGVGDPEGDADPEFVSLLKEVESGLDAVADGIDRLEDEWGVEM